MSAAKEIAENAGAGLSAATYVPSTEAQRAYLRRLLRVAHASCDHRGGEHRASFIMGWLHNEAGFTAGEVQLLTKRVPR